MTPIVVVLCSVSAFLGLPLLAAAAMRWSAATRPIYGACFIVCLVILLVALSQLLSAGSTVSALSLPLGLPWVGAHFRIDALAAFFLVVVNLGGAGASLFAIGYGRHEQAPGRVLPFYAAFLAGMNLVVLADDAFTFLVSWEFMSLSSWALVMAHHHDPENRHAGYVYIVMASFGTLSLLLAFGLLAGGSGSYSFAEMRSAAAVAMTAALLHVLNHSIFKSLLFFGSGAVLTATGERDMEKLGGLIHGMPLTAFTFLAGCMAISALPPLNGFVSEWLIFQAILLSPDLPQWGLKFLVPAVGGMLALSAALAAACFVKAFGVSFLGRPRTTVAAGAKEVDRWSLAAMFIFAGLCLLIGIIPGPIIDTLAPVVNTLVAAHMPMQSADPWLSIVPIAESRSSYNGLLVFVFITISTLAAIEVIHRFASRAVRRGPAWDCGFPDPSPATQYTAGGFAQPIRRVFSALFDAREDVVMPAPGDIGAARLTIRLRDLAWEMLYAPVPTAIRFATEKLNHLQFLSIRQYLSLVFVALVALLLGVSIWP